MTFDPDQYWRDSGPYLAVTSESPEHQEQEQLLRGILSEFASVASVIDVGCGRGRLAAVLKDELPEAEYSGVDLGVAQIAATKRIRPDGKFYRSRLQDFNPDRTWELALCSEVLLHVPPADIAQAVRHLLKLAKTVITIDWTEPVSGEVAEWNWLHNYGLLFGDRMIAETRTGLQTIFVLRGDA